MSDFSQNALTAALVGGGTTVIMTGLLDWVNRNRAQKQSTYATIVAFDRNIVELLVFKATLFDAHQEKLQEVCALENRSAIADYKDTNGNSLFVIFNRQGLDTIPYAEKLSFITSCRAMYLHALSMAQERLIDVNLTIVERSEVIKQNAEYFVYQGKNKKYQEQYVLNMLKDYRKGLDNQMNCALWYLRESIAFLEEYIDYHFCFSLPPKLQFKTGNLNLMPEDNYIPGYRGEIKRHIQVSWGWAAIRTLGRAWRCLRRMLECVSKTISTCKK